MSRLIVAVVSAFVFLLFASSNVFAQCNAGVNSSQVQVNATANQALALQQAAALQAQQSVLLQSQPASFRQTTVSRTRVSALAEPVCTSCQNPQLAAVAPAQAARAQPTLTLAGTNTPAPPGKYVLVSRPVRPAGSQLARR